MKRYVLAVAVFLNAGCVHRVAGLNLVSADAQLAIGSVNSAARSYVMTGEVCQHFVVFPIGKPPTFEAAITKALEQAPGNNALVNATFSTRTVFLLLYAKLCYIASGTPMMLPVR
jgi:hypothetical protein